MSLTTRFTALAAALLVAGAGATFVSASGLFDVSDAPPRGATVSMESTSDAAIAELQSSPASRPQSLDTLTQLASAYLQKVRETGDPSYYARAERVLDEASSIDTDDSQVVAGRAALALARHDFAQAVALARLLPKDDAATFGLLGDALLELGRYGEAFAAFERMAAIKPDSAALARIAYARELRGDRAGAISAMTEATEAAGMRGESAAWLRIQLGHLYFGGGDLDAAEARYNEALSAFPRDIHALAGLGRVHAARGEFAEAIDLYRDVVERQPVPEYVIALGDVYAASGDNLLSQQAYALVEAIDSLFRENGVNTDLELSLFFADHPLREGRTVAPELLARARAAYEKQPSIHAADVLSWVLYKSGRTKEARRYSVEALRLGTQDALLLYHAGTIARAAGDVEEGEALIERAYGINPYFSILYGDGAKPTGEHLPSALALEWHASNVFRP